MKLSRRGILGALLGSAAVPAAMVEAKPKQTFQKGMIVPRFHLVPAYTGYAGGDGGHAHPVQMVTTSYEIFDGEKFVTFNSDAGQQVLRDLS